MECGLQRPPTGRPETDSRVGDGADRASHGGPLPPPAVGGAAPALQARRMLGGSLTGAKSGGRLRQALSHCGAQCRTPSWALLLGADAVPSPACTPSPPPPPPPLLSWSRPGPAVLRRVQGGQSRGWCPPRQERVADKLRSKRRPQGLRAAWEEARGARRRVDLAKGRSHGTSVTLTTEAKLHKPR